LKILISIALLIIVSGQFLKGEDILNESNKRINKSTDEIVSMAYRPPSPETIRRQGNHLKGENSVYLQQHAYNPMDWYPWGETAINRAKSEDKPIFLSIGYSSCHWCHVMEQQVFTSDDIAEFMNENFINIKVDREERPDLDAVYMDAVQALTGGGGWPMSVFLTPALKPFYGGTYFPYQQFKQLTGQLKEIYFEQRDKVENQASQLEFMLSRQPAVSPDSELKPEVIETIARSAESYYDSQWGGFSEQMKFPTPVRWLFLLHYYRKTGDARYSEMIKQTLDQMGWGGIHDQIGGGFHRYTVERTWLVPHFEKMLYDNAQIAGLYIEASTVFDDPGYAAIARAALDFMIRDLSGSEGGFYASYDADSDGEEGLFYLWSYDEVIKLAGEDDGPVLAEILGITPEGNFEGRNIITRRTDMALIGEKFGRSENEMNDLFNKYLPKLRSYRSERTWPNLDKKIITSWNGLAIAAFARGYAIFKDDRYRTAAEKTADYILRTHLRTDSSLYRSSYDGNAENEGILDDYAFLAYGLLELYQATGKLDYLRQALKFIEYVEANFKNDEAGYYLTNQRSQIPLGRKIELYDSVRPSGNSAMLQAILMAGAITGNTDYHEIVSRTINAYAEIISKAGLEMAWWADTALKLNGPYYDIIIAGDKGSGSMDKLVATFWKINPAHAALTLIPAKGADDSIVKFIPATSDKTAIEGQATAYVCKYGVCKLPTGDPDVFRNQLMEGWER